MPETASGPDRPARSFSYAAAADRDVEGILSYTESRFGPRQRDRYAQLIDQAASMVAAGPARRGSRARDDLMPGLRSFTVELAARRRGAGAHVLYYLQIQSGRGENEVLILRVLHERMDPMRHIVEEQ